MITIRNKINLKNYKFVKAGSEAVVYRVDDICFKYFQYSLSQEIRQRKKAKLLFLKELTHLQKYYPEIYYFVITSILKKFKGYAMEHIEGNLLYYTYLNLEQTMSTLSKLHSILTEFNNAGIFYQDIRTPNIMMLPNGDITLLDIDSITTKEHPELDAIPNEINKYMKNGGKPGINTQIAMFNHLTNRLLNKYYNPYYTDKSIEIDKEGLQIISDLNNHKVDSSFDHEYLHQHIKRIK